VESRCQATSDGRYALRSAPPLTRGVEVLYDIEMPNDPRISVVVPAYNAAGTLSGCLQALLQMSLSEPYEVIVVDDGSTDDTARIAEGFVTRDQGSGVRGQARKGTGRPPLAHERSELSLAPDPWPPVRLLRRAHKGAAAARNAGVEIARGEVILFTDADCEPVPEWATVLLAAIHGGADGAKGTYRTRQPSLVARFVQAEYESKYRHMEGRDHIDFIDTYSAAYRREALLEAGGFNENLPVDEDQELSFRLAEHDRRLVYTPEAVVYHRHVTTPVDYVRRKFRIGYWKVFVGSMHPKRMLSDSHTPQSMKLEMLLAGAGLVAFAVSPLMGHTSMKAARKLGPACALGFFLTTLPFVARVALKDPAVAAIAPGMLLLRALALGCGVAAGTLRIALLYLRKGHQYEVQ
jgi:cellulose synthase/poly-beta-1,6-N-acetylglucosamine synthase-like glycosyltransferase